MKHVLKRWWRALVGEKGVTLGDHTFNHHVLERLLELSGAEPGAIDRILRTDDKQSVPKALEAILAFQKFATLETTDFARDPQTRKFLAPLALFNPQETFLAMLPTCVAHLSFLSSS